MKGSTTLEGGGSKVGLLLVQEGLPTHKGGQLKVGLVSPSYRPLKLQVAVQDYTNQKIQFARLVCKSYKKLVCKLHECKQSRGRVDHQFQPGTN